MPEIIVILVIALIIFGPSKLPEVARSVGKGIQEFKNLTMGVERTMKDEFDAIMKDGEEPPKPGDTAKPADQTMPEETKAPEESVIVENPSDQVVFPGETETKDKT